MKKWRTTQYLFTAAISMVLLFGGCSAEGNKAPEVPVVDGTYVLENEGNVENVKILFDIANGRFTIKIRNREFLSGNAEVRDGKIRATTDDEKFTYVFDIEDEKTLRILEDESDELVTVSGERDSINVSEGSKFVLIEE